MSDLVLIRNLRKKIGQQLILKDLSFTLPSVGLIGILGPSGCGKTTLLNILAGLDGKFKGSVVALGRSLNGMDEDSRADFRLREIGYVTQIPSLLELENVFTNVTIPLETLYADSKKNIERKTFDALRFVGLDKKAKRRVNSLSGGEKARVSLARALANDPRIILADEPTGALDSKNSERVFSLLKRTSLKRLVVVVSHDEDTLRRYADRVLLMKDGEIEDDQAINNDYEGNPPASIRLDYIKNVPSLSGFTLFRHARSVMKARRVRKIICTAMISLGLLGLGLSTYIYFSLDEQVGKALSGFIPDSCLVMEKANAPSSPYSNIYACDMKLASQLARDNEEINGYGVTLITDYESVFPDENDFYIYKESGNNYRLEDFSSRSINDFLWIEESTKVYPAPTKKMALNEVVLGLPYDYMFRLAFELGSIRDYESLGNFLKGGQVSMLCLLANDAAGFENDDLFDIVGVVETEVPCFYHTDTLWNYHYFIDHLHFHDVSYPGLKNMQEMFALPFLGYEKEFEKYIKRNRDNEKLASLIYDPFQADYMPSLEDEANPLSLKRMYLYSADKYGISSKEIGELREFCSSIEGTLPGSTRGFYASSSSLLSGFSNRVYLSNNESISHQIGETCSIMGKEDAELPISLPTGSISAELSSGADGIRLVGGKKRYSVGHAPSSIHEICLSSTLYSSWGEPEYIYLTYERKREDYEDVVLREFSYASLKVVGVEIESKPTMYVPSYWTYDFPLCALGASGFDLEPSGYLLNFPSDSEASKAMESLSKNFPSYNFLYPSKEVRKTVDETTSYIGVVLIAFSFLALIVASVLFFTAMSITVEESKGELNMFYRIGISRADRVKSIRMFVLNQTLSSLIPSLLILVVLEVATNLFISKMFATAAGFPLSWPPFAAMAAAGVLFYFLLSVTTYLIIGESR
ncbi:MAG: ATP-binding cassette domain-containing protein [Bacilli bacterium]|nr:ATP-binding cassette domain-containing protein [Bacilli bacterium]